MPATYEYVNTITNKKIDEQSLLFSNSCGVIEAMGQGNALKFTPKEYIDVRVTESNEGYDKADVPGLPGDINTLPYDVSAPDYSTNYVNARKYLFGIDKLSISRSVPAAVNGFISKPVSVGSCSYIELAVKASTNNNIEYSIIEGLNETPILPAGQTEVMHEKLFYGLSTRFTPDMTKKIKIYKDGQETSYTYEQLNSIEFGNGEYTISYTPIKTAHTYYPKTGDIKIKAVQRFRTGQIPAAIQSMVILRHGGDKIWTM